MKLNHLLLTAIIAVSTCSAYAQVTIGRPAPRAFTGHTIGGKNGKVDPGKLNPGKVNSGNSNQSNNNVSNNNNSTTSAASFSNDQISKANTAKDATYLSQAEKDVILYCNLARLDGQTFANQYLGKLKGSSNSYEQSLLKDLAGVKGLPMLKPNSKLAKAAKVHVDDIGPKGLTQHESSDGTETFTRVRKYYNGGYMGENISFGYSDAMDIVLQLLIDDGVECLGHRHNILNKNFVRLGVSIGSHKQYRSCCVQDFADDRDDSGNSNNNNNGGNNNNNNVNNNNNNRPNNNNVNNGGHRPNNNRYDDYDDDDDYGDYGDDDDDDYGCGYDDDDDDGYDCGYGDDYDFEDDEYYNDSGDYYDDDTYCDDDEYYYDDDDYDDDDDAFFFDF